MTIITRGRKRNGTTTLPSILRKKLVGNTFATGECPNS